jgi:hypothetical protein
MYVVISFQDEYSRSCGRGCCIDESGCADLEISQFDDYDKLVEYLARRCAASNPQDNLVFTNWRDFSSFARGDSVYTKDHEDSIRLPGFNEGFYSDDDYAEFNKLQAEEASREELTKRLRGDVAAKMGVNSLKAKQEAEAKRLREAKEAAERQKIETEKRERAEFERIRNKYGEKS